MVRHGTRHTQPGGRGRANQPAQALAQVDFGERVAGVGLPVCRPDRARARPRADALPRSDPAARRLSARLLRGGPGAWRRPRHGPATGNLPDARTAVRGVHRSVGLLRSWRSARRRLRARGWGQLDLGLCPARRPMDRPARDPFRRADPELRRQRHRAPLPGDQGAKDHRQGRHGAEDHPRAVRHLERPQRRCGVSRLRRGRRLSRPYAEVPGSAHRRADPPHARGVRGTVPPLSGAPGDVQPDPLSHRASDHRRDDQPCPHGAAAARGGARRGPCPRATLRLLPVERRHGASSVGGRSVRAAPRQPARPARAGRCARRCAGPDHRRHPERGLARSASGVPGERDPLPSTSPSR